MTLLRVYILGETELGEPPYQCICFLSSYAKDLILPEAVQKLRQKHPDAIRLAEQDNGNIPMQLGSISSHLPDFCRDAPPGRILSSRHEIHNIMGNSSSSLGHNTNNYEGTPRCYNLEEEGECLCSLRVCFNWFPCALKYCSNKEGEGEHRCGIKTCRKCNTFRYAVPSPAHCHWDEI
ncbi:hypothetical protein FKW44_004725 [Caligus rogercresseyi]|uniref:Out at first protein n=1 Tax=Caligus rogercresseyi TaxID=217165 RepID=A0A7T8HM98_CALRO|nr:hypothetical protein FKW44_004725 [Caligus rogercresseyi]